MVSEEADCFTSSHVIPTRLDQLERKLERQAADAARARAALRSAAAALTRCGGWPPQQRVTRVVSHKCHEHATPAFRSRSAPPCAREVCGAVAVRDLAVSLLRTATVSRAIRGMTWYDMVAWSHGGRLACIASRRRDRRDRPPPPAPLRAPLATTTTTPRSDATHRRPLATRKARRASDPSCTRARRATRPRRARRWKSSARCAPRSVVRE